MEHINDGGVLCVSIAETARRLQRHPNTVRRMIRLGMLTTIPCPHNPMVVLESLNEYIERMKGGGTRKPPAGANGHKPKKKK